MRSLRILVFLPGLWLVSGCEVSADANRLDGGPPTDAGAVDGGPLADAGPRSDGGQDADPCAIADRDGDGQRAIECGGLDCDDADPQRYAGNAEVCDVASHDEDCDPRTFGFRDGDGDQFPDALCCNVDELGARVCGSDCDDLMPGANPMVPEVCNERDDDCNGTIDEGVQSTFFADTDRDGFGDPDVSIADCALPPGTVEDAGDCDDRNPAIRPGAAEVCNGGDDDCGGVADDGAAAASCIGPAVSAASCRSGACVIERCEVGAGDCDRLLSNGCETDTQTTVEHCGACGNACGAGAARCSGGRCVSICVGDTHDCDGMCVPSSSPLTCGTRCEPCPPPLTDGIAACAMGACSATCLSASYVAQTLPGGALDCVWDDPSLAALSVSPGALVPAFSPGALDYLVRAPSGTSALSFTPSAIASASLSVTIAGASVAVGSASAPIAIGPETLLPVSVTAESGRSRAYQLHVARSPSVGSYLKASNTSPGREQFGFMTAIDGDTLVVGAPFEDGPNDMLSDSGAVYVFVRSGSTWSPQALLRAANAGASDRFGISVAISGNTIAVAADGEDSGSSSPTDNSAPSAGAVYVFVRSGTTWSPQAYLKAPEPGAGDAFGIGLAIEGDTIAVGAPGEDSAATGIDGDASDEGAPQAGAAYVFVRSGTTWSPQAYVKATNTDPMDELGFALDLSGDTLVVGAIGEASDTPGEPLNDTAYAAGAAYVLVRSGTTWTHQAYLKGPAPDPMDGFGVSVAVDGDTIVVGASLDDSRGTDPEDDSRTDAGAAFVFRRAGVSWALEQMLKPAVTGAGDRFGASVAISGDAILVGAYAEDGGGRGLGASPNDDMAPDAGAAYLFARAVRTWTMLDYIKATNADPLDQFGLSVARALPTW